MPSRVILYVLILGFILLDLSSVRAEDVVIRTDQLVTDSFLGFGAEWDIHSYAANDITDSDFKLITDRVNLMKLPIVRVMVLANYCYRGNGKYDWNSIQMQYLYKQLEFCQKIGIKVIICAWGVDDTWMRVAGVSGIDDPRYAKVVGTIMDHLVNTKGFSCIKFFSAGNEPDWVVKDWGKWKRSARNIADSFNSNGLRQKVLFFGPETSQGGAAPWLHNSASYFSGTLDAYGMHYYAPKDIVANGGLEQLLVEFRGQLSTDTSTKPFIVSEAGMQDGSVPPATNSHTSEYDYGVFMTDYAVQAARAGASSVLAWMLDDNSHKNYNWGMWADKSHGMALRRWYTPWSLLSHYFPSGVSVCSVSQPRGMRILAAIKPPKSTGEGTHYSFCLVNRSSFTRQLMVHFAHSQHEVRLFKRFTYIESDPSPYPAAVIERYDLKGAVPVTCPPNSVILLTTL